MIISRDSHCPMYIEVVWFVIFDRVLGFSQLNEVRRHNTAEENNMEMTDRKLNRSYQSIQHPTKKRKSTIECELLKKIDFTSGQL